MEAEVCKQTQQHKVSMARTRVTIRAVVQSQPITRNLRTALIGISLSGDMAEYEVKYTELSQW